MSNEFGALRLGSQVLFGVGMVQAAGPMAARHGGRALVCTDPQVSQTPGFAKTLMSLKEHLDVHVFDRGKPELPRAVVEEAVERSRAYDPDVILGVGGGSSCVGLCRGARGNVGVRRSGASW